MRTEHKLQKDISGDEDSSNSRSVSITKHKILEQRLTDFYGVNSEEVPRIQSEEVSWGDAKGNER